MDPSVALLESFLILNSLVIYPGAHIGFCSEGGGGARSTAPPSHNPA